MTKKLVFILLIFAVLGCGLKAQETISKQTFLYSVKGADSLYLDKYDLPSIKGDKPCVIFVFGGGFKNGERDRPGYMPYFTFLAKQGYSVVSIDYRLGFKNLSAKQQNIDPMGLVDALNKTITIAVEDLFDATNYILNHAGEWGIDKNAIIASGSSAGAVTVLQAEYAICNQVEPSLRLPNNFNYAGIMSYAGAIFSMNGDLKWNRKPAPILMFHGDADKNVPFDKLEMFTIGFYGSSHIAAQLDSLKNPYFFYKIENAAHEIATKPMLYNQDEIKTFLDKFVKQKQQLMIQSDVIDLDKPIIEDKNFSIMDFIMSNYGGL